MIIYIPLAIGQTIPEAVSKSIAMQSIPCEIVLCETEGVVDSSAHKRQIRIDTVAQKAKLTGQNSSRNLALFYVDREDDEFVVIQDRDIVHLDKDNVSKALEYIKANPKLGAVHLPAKNYLVRGHYNLQAVLYRKKALDGFLYRFDRRLHGCACAYEDMIAKGWEVEWLPSPKKLILEIRS